MEKNILKNIKNEIRGVENMISDEKYIKFLKAIISCVSHGDYFSVKELSNLELEKMMRKEKHTKKKVKKTRNYKMILKIKDIEKQ